MTSPRIYAACLASYNNGRLHSAWIDCDQDADAIRAAIAAMLAKSPVPDAEEWAIHDHEGFAGLIQSEWPDLDELAAAAPILALDDDDDVRRGLLWLVNDRGYTLADAIDRAADVHTFTSDALDLATDFAQELAANTIENFDEKMAQWPFSCIDWRQAGKELLIGGDIDETTQDGERFLVTNANEF